MRVNRGALLAGLALAACGAGDGGNGGRTDAAEPSVEVTDLATDPSPEEATAPVCAPDMEHPIFAVIDPANGAAAHVSAAGDGEGGAWVAYAELQGGQLRGAKRGPSGWSVSVLDAAGVHLDPWIGRSVAVAVDRRSSRSGSRRAGQARGTVAFHNSADETLQLATIEPFALGVGVRSTLDDTTGAGVDVSIAVAGDTVHVAYLDLGAGDLQYLSGVGDTWTRETVDSLGVVGNDPSIALAPDGTPAISYYHCGALVAGGCDAGALKLARRLDGVWASEILDADGDAGWYTSLAFDAAGQPGIAYHAHAAGQLRFIMPTVDGWRGHVVDPGPGAGLFASLVLAHGAAYVAYQDTTSHALKLAVRGPDDVWTTRVIDSGGAGAYASLAPDGACGLFLAYVHPTDGVKVATFPPLSAK